MPELESGNNCIIVAPTGSGKTEAAVLPLVAAHAKRHTPISILYITPLRALNRDMLGRLKWLCDDKGMSIGVRHGDTARSERARQAKKAPDLLITTPETLQSMLPARSMRGYLKNVRAVVVDELHEIYHSKRGAQLSIGLERLERLSPGFQRIGLSATVGDRETMRRFLCNARKCKIVSDDSSKDMRVTIEYPQRVSAYLGDFTERFGLDKPSAARLERIDEIVGHSSSALVFANTRQIVESLGSRLLGMDKELGRTPRVEVHHSSLDREERIGIEDRFKSGKTKGIIATSSLELGIDIGSIDRVIQYGSPRQAVRLSQRVGRSGHTHSGTANGTIIATGTMDIIESSAVAQLALAASFETFRPQAGAIDVLANQVCGIALDNGSISAQELHGIIRGSFLYNGIDIAALESLLRFMERLRLIGFDGKKITSGGRTRMHYYGHLSMIPDSKRFIVRSAMDNRIISTLDERFVANHVDSGSVFITKGLPWKVLDISEDTILVEPSTDVDAAVPDWSGEDIPVSMQVALRVKEILGGRGMELEGCEVAQDAKSPVGDLVGNGAEMPGKNEIVLENFGDHCMLYTFLGTQGNEALAKMMTHHIGSNDIGASPSPYSILFETGSNVNIERVLRSVAAADVGNLAREAIAGTELFRYRFINVAKAFGVMDREAVVSRSVAKRIIRVMSGTPLYEEAVREVLMNYFDVPVLSDFLNGIKNGTVVIKSVTLGSASALATAIIGASHQARELMLPLKPNSELVENFASFVLSKSTKLLCTYCGVSFSRRLEEIKESRMLLCPGCGSPMVSIYSDDYKKTVDRRIAGKKLDRRDRKLVEEMLRYSSLFESYGPKAAIALSVYGIGQRSAARALMMLKRSETDFFIDLLDAQRNFIRTRRYWSV